MNLLYLRSYFHPNSPNRNNEPNRSNAWILMSHFLNRDCLIVIILILLLSCVHDGDV